MNRQQQATLTISGEAAVQLPLLVSTHGSDCLDIRSLGARTGCFAYDSGFTSTAGCKSGISFVDSAQGQLLYRGYPVEQLAERCNFLEVAYLLRHGELPNAGQLTGFRAAIARHAPVHEQMVKFYEGFRRDARPMAVMVGVVGALSAFHHEAADVSDAAQRTLSFHRIVARMPTIVAMAHKYSIGQPFMRPRPDLDYSNNFLYMMFATPRQEYRPNPVLASALDRLLTVYADYGQDAATATVRMAGSSGANPFACVSAAIACLSGPAHGGASEACLAMLEEIGDAARATRFVTLVRERDGGGGAGLPGFGQRVFRQHDPRVNVMRQACDDVLRELGLEQSRLFKLARTIERIALEDPYCVEQQLQPTVDFYGSLIQKALGIPPSMFACTLALARTAGWMAQWEEMLSDPEYRIARPRQLYNGVARRGLTTLVQS
ncbi:MAG: citrate (Si)-synthase [Candidatus Accumulibacter sp.]|uniref:citrate synthase n=1 Tax=Accumulibacter sp. TaxID=2053492 RepID=UPI001A4BEE4C|nr:citrate synthase [Accumulibacter sp.]MBL8394582.1 citrate (Si)-synthase [Accumulibacter sp.]